MEEEKKSEVSPDVLTIVGWLHDAGYRAVHTANGRGVESATSGLRFFIGIFEFSLQFSMGMYLEDLSITHEDCNFQNREWRFTKTYLDADNDFVVEMDLILDLGSGDARDVFVKSLNLWDSGLGRIKQWLASRPKTE